MAILEQRKKSNNCSGISGNSNGNNSGNNASNNSTSLISKGKNNNSSSSGGCDAIQIRIKPNIQNSRNNYQDVTVSIALSSTVYQLKEKIRSSCYNSSNNSNGTSNSNSTSSTSGSSSDNSTSNNCNDGNTSVIHNCNNKNNSSNNNNINNTPTIAAISTISRDRYLRLICSGRLLAPDSTTLSELKFIKDGSVVHAILAAPGVRGGQQATLSRDRRHGSQRRLRGIGIGSNGLVLPRRNNDDDDDDDDIEEGRQRMGFDRLRANGMSRSEIVAIRAYFSRQVDRFIEQRTQLENNTNSNTSDSTSSNNSDNEDPRIQRLRMEEEWMERQGPYSEFRLNINSNNPLFRSRAYINGIEIDTTTPGGMSEFRSGSGASSIIGALGTNRDFIWGFVLGYSFGFMTMFIVWLPTVPHKQRVGILCGFCFHMSLRILERKVVEE